MAEDNVHDAAQAPAALQVAQPDVTADVATASDPEVPPFRYNARLAELIELRWQDRWEADGTFHTASPAGPLSAGFDRAAGRPKFFVADMFPYPSGMGIHVGHPIGYIATDVYARYLRMTGHHVLHTMGFDAFGLPAEQFALETGQHPRVSSRRNIDTMRAQLRRMGMGYDPRRSVETSDPRFYRWTQWMFLQIWGSWVDDRTGRARPIADLIAAYASGDRPVPGGAAWADLTPAQRRQLVDDHRLAYLAAEPVNWCPGLGTVLANEEVTADGRSDIGNFPVYRRPMRQWMMRITAMAQRLLDNLDELAWPENIKQLQRNWIGVSDGADIALPLAGDAGGQIEVFTTRPDTLYGATFVVLAPEHPLADRLARDAWPDGTPERWRGLPAATPAAAVAAYKAATTRLTDRQRTALQVTKSGVFTGSHAVNPMTGESIPVFVADYVLPGYGTGAIMAVPAHDLRDADFAREFGLPVRAVTSPDGAYVAAPGPVLAGLDTPAAIEATVSWLVRAGFGHAARRYRLRDWLFSRQRYWGEPFPIVYDDSGAPLALPERELPVLIPDLADFRPDPDQDQDSDPVPPLARAPNWATVAADLGDGLRTYRRELNTMPQWAGSCWYYLRYTDPDNDTAFAGQENERYFMAPGGVDLYVGGAEHAVLHLLYARFWHKVLYDLGLVSTPEPFARLVNQGMITADAFTDERGRYVPASEVSREPDGSASYRGERVSRRSGKMGKSLKNGISPDEMYQRYGADTLRLYEMAMGPIESDKPWQTDDVVGVHRFLQRLWRTMIDEQSGELTVSDAPLDGDTLHALHATIAAVRRDFGLLRFNTAIARLMELTTVAARISAAAGGLPRDLAEPLVLMVAPLAPHVAEELWARLGHGQSLAYADYPAADAELAAEQSVTVPVQVNGRTRFTITVPSGAGADAIESVLAGHPDFAKHTAGHAIERLVIVPGRIVNVVTSVSAPASPAS
jgi:leucyl-tRNA synthetase